MLIAITLNYIKKISHIKDISWFVNSADTLQSRVKIFTWIIFQGKKNM